VTADNFHPPPAISGRRMFDVQANEITQALAFGRGHGKLDQPAQRLLG
jgi:hypothetical protein